MWEHAVEDTGFLICNLLQNPARFKTKFMSTHILGIYRYFSTGYLRHSILYCSASIFIFQKKKTKQRVPSSKNIYYQKSGYNINIST
jgi:hypothetical protein